MLLDDDLTAAARIRNAALRGFAIDGVAATSIRDVARTAGVSAGLVQHHYKSKDALRDAVNEYVARIGAQALAGLEEVTDPDDLVPEIADRLTALMRDHHLALLYVTRAVADGDEAAIAVFDGFVAVADEHVGRLARLGLLREDLDLRWAALHVVILNLGTALLESAVSRHLEAPLRSPRELQRWNVATTALFRSGIFGDRGRR